MGYRPRGISVRHRYLVFLIGAALACLVSPSRAGAQFIYTVAGNGTSGYSGDGGLATSAQVYNTFGVAVDAQGNIYIADTDNQRIRVINAGKTAITVATVTIQPGDIATVAGNGTAGYAGDGGPATNAEFYNPSGVAVDSAGNIYIADLYNFRVRKVNASGIVSTVTGTGTQAAGGDNGLAANATLYPYAVAVDSRGILYIADTYNQRIRVVNTSTSAITLANVTIQPENIATVAGNGTYGPSANGPAANAEFSDPYSLAVDSRSNIYICDTYNRQMRVVNTGTSPITVANVTIPPGDIATVAGNGNYGFRGDGYPASGAEFADPDGIAVDSAGNIYVSDLENERIRMVNNASGLASTMAGMGGAGTNGYGYNGDGIPAASALIAYPRVVAVDSAGNVYFSDEPNFRIRKIAVNPAPPTIVSRTSTAFTAGLPGTFTVTATDLPVSTLTESGALPTGVTFTDNGNNTGTLSGTPAAGTAGTYNIVFTASNGVLPNAVQNFTLTIYAPGGGPAASFVSQDTNTEGNWQGVYGGDGYSLAGASQSIPGYASLAVQNLVPGAFTWVASTTDVRALQVPGTSSRIAAAWYNSASFSFDVNFTDGNSHQVALYALDWDIAGRAETIQILDANSGVPLDTETVSNFASGTYLIWKISGHVQIVVTATATGGINAVVSGVFFGGGVPSLSITKTHTGLFTQGQQNATYTVTVSNQANAGPTNGSTVTVTETVPSGLTLVSMAGTGWTCPSNANTCTRSNALSGGTSYPPITVTVNVAANAASPQVNQVSVSGGGSVSSSATDPTGINAGTVCAGSCAALVSIDTHTEGNWRNVYGADGYSLANVTPQSIPSYASFTPQNQSLFTWVASTTDPRALQVPGSAESIAAAWYGNPTFSFDLNLTDGNTHQFALYALDWDGKGRAETIQIVDAASNSPLNTQTISNFANGIYLVWNISGHVKINVTLTAGPNAVVSGVFFGGQPSRAIPAITWATPSAITFGTALGSTQLNATSTVAGSFVYSPAAGAVLGAGSQTLSVTFTPTDTTDYTTTTVTVTLVVNRAAPIITWPAPAAITYGTALGSTQLNATAAFNGVAVSGSFVYSPAAGTVLGVGSPTLSVTFTPTDTVDYTAATATVTLVVNPAATGNQAAFVRSDGATQGNWQGAYGADGYSLSNVTPQSIPSYATFAVQNQSSHVWAASTGDSRALLIPGSTTQRIAAAWYSSPSFSFDVNFTDGNTHQFALYALDWDSQGRSETIQVEDGTINAVLDTRTISAFSNGIYLVWNISGHVKIIVAGTAGPNSVVSAVFFGGSSNPKVTPTITWATPAPITYGTALSGTQLNATASVPGSFAYNPAAGTVLGVGSQTLSVTFTPTDTVDYTTATGTVTLVVNPAPSANQAAFVGSDTATQGNWHGVYGADGYSVANDSQSLPAYASFALQGQASYTWTASTTDPRALQTGSGSGRIAAAWYNYPGFSMNVNFTDGNAHQFALYALDWDKSGRAETIQIQDATTNAVLDTRTISAFSNGIYLVWSISGSVKIVVTATAGPNSAVSGIFFGAGGSPTTPNLSITKTHSGNFTQGQQNATYVVTVSNAANATPTSGTVTVTETVPLGLTLVSMAGTGWTCPAGGSACTRSDALSGGASYPAITVTVNVAANASSPQVNQVSASGGGSATANASDSTTINVANGGSVAALFVKEDTSTQGNWQGVYGAGGYSLADVTPQSIPSYATFAVRNQAMYVWAASTTDSRALLVPGSTTQRIAATWYSSSSFSFDVNFTDGNSHQFTLYAVDWNGAGRAETIQILNPSTNTVLDTRTISSFSSGVYLVWDISGQVTINVTLTGGPNTVVSGAFFQ